MAQRITLGNIGKGRAADLFNQLVDEVVEDVARDDKNPEDERSFTLKFIFKPKEDGVVYGSIETGIKLAPRKPISEVLQLDSQGALWQQDKLPELPGMDGKVVKMERPAPPAAAPGGNKGGRDD